MKKRFLIYLAICVLLINSCSSFKAPNEKQDTVSEATDYYKGHFLVLADQYTCDKSLSYVDVTPKYIGDDYVAVYIQTEKTQDNRTITNECVEIYDYYGNLALQTKLKDIEPGRSFPEMCMGTTGKGISMLLADNKTSYMAMYCIDFEVMKWQKCFDYPMNGLKTGFSPIKVFESGDSFIVLYMWLDGNYYKSGIVKFDHSGKVIWDKKIESNSSVTNAELWNDDLVYYDEQFGFCRLNLNTESRQTIEMSKDLYDTYKYYGNVAPDGRIIAKEGHEIREFDLSNGSEKVIQDLNYTDCNIFQLYDGFLSYVGTNKTVILDLCYSRNEAPGRCKLYVLDKEDKNPHFGKRILEIAPVWGIYSLLGEAQRIFNKENKDYFAYITTRYDIDHFTLPDYYKANPTLANFVTLITDQLSVDIRNGSGPDIVVGLGDTTRLDSDDYLVNLFPYMNGREGIDRSDYFANAFKAFECNNHLYQIPLTMNVLGVMTDKKNVPNGQKGFSFEEYSKLVSDKCNGIDPISVGNNREQYFRYLFCSMQNAFISNKTINVDNEAFRTLTKYAKNNVSIDGYLPDTESYGADWVILSNLYSDLLWTKCSDLTWDIYGAPSYDRQGPMVSNFNTIAVTACSSNKDTSWMFVKTAIGFDAQITLESENPINRSAFMEFAHKALNDANVTLKERYDPRVFDESYIDNYVCLLEKADCVAAFDAEIYQIIVEELQPYYAGDKDLDKVIPVIKNRCQTILNER